MPTISRFYGITIQMYWNDKHGPHFHAIYGEDEALISIVDGAFLAGTLPQRAYRLVLEWLAVHRIELAENWERARRHESLNKVGGLE
jgi:hypothetical protein